jgi:hypothetical protein
MKAALLAVFGVCLLACKGDPVTDDELLAALGKECGQGLGCDNLTSCGTVDITYHICEFDCASDPTTCPKGSFCSKNGLDENFYCMRECTTDQDCTDATGNDTLKCNNGTSMSGGVGALVCGVFP